MKMKLNKIVVLTLLGVGVLGFGGNAVAGEYEITEQQIQEAEKKYVSEYPKNKHIQHAGTDWYFEHRYGTPDKERQELWLEFVKSDEKYKPKIKEWLSQKISQEKLKQALKLTSPLNKNTSKTLSQDEIQALKTETQVLRQQFANYLNYHSNGFEPKKLYQDKFRFLYNRSKDLIILIIGNKVKDKELLEMTLEYRKALEEEFLEENKKAKNGYWGVLKAAVHDSYQVFIQAEKEGKAIHRMPEHKEAVKELGERDDVKKFDIIEEDYKRLNTALEQHIYLLDVKVVN
ncbi:hypothetical protein HT665_09300 [Ursidibacter maritimus]|uniref:Uncharacterized protein n=1 Tax=Ursidibacter maritimus TaxID=1331689 RepID=A0A949T9N7_9PAST|nr:hypothetical protein [Ursidibacter maritimus]MBV6539743.1 hypothetical protein [Ursidibacter maritimus]MBV6543542.1 hypothetical protein [Ursidibacter maritimus]MBV6547444.1 hypothetical protein [Ursidibacter maritimus]